MELKQFQHTMSVLWMFSSVETFPFKINDQSFGTRENNLLGLYFSDGKSTHSSIPPQFSVSGLP